MKEEELNKLLLGCRKNDSVYQKELYRQFYNYAFVIANRYSQASNDTEEIVNDAFFSCFTKINQFDLSMSFKPWFSKIVIHSAINYFKKYKENIPFREELGSAIQSTSDYCILSDLSQKEIVKMVESLSPGYRIVFKLYVLDGMKHEEIAKMLEISENTSKSNLSRARQKLQLMIEAIENHK